MKNLQSFRQKPHPFNAYRCYPADPYSSEGGFIAVRGALFQYLHVEGKTFCYMYSVGLQYMYSVGLQYMYSVGLQLNLKLQYTPYYCKSNLNLYLLFCLNLIGHSKTLSVTHGRKGEAAWMVYE